MPRKKKETKVDKSNKTIADTLYEEMTKGLGEADKRAKKGTKEYNDKLATGLRKAIEHLFDIENAFGIFGLPDNMTNIRDTLINGFLSMIDKRIERIVKEKLKEYDKKRQTEPTCPVCRAFGDMIEDVRKGNDVFGPGYRR